MGKIVWKFDLNGKNNVLEVKINHFTGKVRFVLNGYLHYTTEITSIANWQNIPFQIGGHSCNFIYTTEMVKEDRGRQQYDLIIDGYSIVTGKLFNATEHKKRYLSKFYQQFFRSALGAVIVAFASGYLLATMDKSLTKFLLQVFIVAIGFYIGVKLFDIITYIMRLIKKAR